MFYFIVVGWIFGIAWMGQKVTVFPEVDLWGCLVLIFIIFLQLIFYKKLHSYILKFLCLLASFILSMIVGFTYANYKLDQRLVLKENQIERTSVLVYVKQIPELKENGVQQKVEVLNRKSEVVQWLASIKGKDHGLVLGKYYILTGRLKPAHGYATPGSFDLEKWYIEQNIMGNFKVETIKRISFEDIHQQGYSIFAKKQNSWLMQSLLWIEKQRLKLRIFIQHQPIVNKGLSLALLTGDESLLDKPLEQQFQRFGISHLLAISGPHVVIFAMMICWFLQYIIARFKPIIYLKIPKQYLLIFPFLICVFIYCAFVGFEIPALRTLLVCVIGSIIILIKQQIRPLSLLLLSACILLLFDPFSILSAAFWLSYGACFILLRIYQTIQYEQVEHLSFLKKIQRNVFILMESQWKIFIALFPLMIIFFNQIAWITPISNLFAIPLISVVIVPFTILAGIAYFIFEPLSSVLFQLNDWMLSLLLWCINLLDTLFAPQLYAFYLNVWVLCSLFLALIILYFPKGIVPKSLSIICITPIFFTNHMQQSFELILLDVGQGQAIFIRNKDKTMMLDTGGSYKEDEFSIGQQVILPFLSIQNSKHLDILMLSHLDQDHSGAYFKIRNQLNINKLYSNEPVDGAASTELCQRGQRLNLGDGIEIHVLSPSVEELPKAKFEQNDMSCVVYIQLKNAYPYQNYLLMGDAGWETEFKILQQYPNLAVDVLVLGHHGSQHSSAYDFLKTLHPKIVFISAGFDNRYGHPSIKTIKRLEKLKIPYLSTVKAGTIQIKMSKSREITITPYRSEKKWLQYP